MLADHSYCSNPRFYIVLETFALSDYMYVTFRSLKQCRTSDLNNNLYITAILTFELFMCLFALLPYMLHLYICMDVRARTHTHAHAHTHTSVQKQHTYCTHKLYIIIIKFCVNGHGWIYCDVTQVRSMFLLLFLYY